MLNRLQNIPTSIIIFLLIVPFVIIWYGMYVFNLSNIGSIPLYLFQLLADSISLVIVGSLWLTLLLDILQPEHLKRATPKDLVWLEKTPMTVDVFVTVVNEPLEIIKSTLTAARDITYPHKTYVLDDGNNETTKKLAEALGIGYITRPKSGRLYAKAGNINNALNYCHGEFFAVFDADHVPKPNFLDALLPYFHHATVGLVQTPQFYANTDSFIASGTSQAQEIFYHYVMPAKNSYNSAFCVGTNMIIRRSAINEIGGIAKLDHSEDIWTTIHLHEKGFETIFHGEILAIGRAPETVGAFFRQQNRWAQGGFSLLLTHNPMRNKFLTLDQKLQYLSSNFFFMGGIAVLIYLIMPLVYLLTNLHPMRLGSGYEWFVHYFPYFLTSYLLPLFLTTRPKLSTICISLSSFYPYLRALFATLFQVKFIWVATENKKNGPSSIMTHIWPHVLIATTSMLSLLIGWYNTVDFSTTVATTAWVGVNTFILLVFIKESLKSA